MLVRVARKSLCGGLAMGTRGLTVGERREWAEATGEDIEEYLDMFLPVSEFDDTPEYEGDKNYERLFEAPY